MKRKVFIISRSGGLKDHLKVKKALSVSGIDSSIINIHDDQHEKLIRKCRNEVLLIQDEHSPSFYNLKKQLFKNNVDFMTFGRLTPLDLSLSYGNLDIGFNKDVHRKICCDHNIPDIKTSEFEIAIDTPPESVPYKYQGYFRSPYLLVKNLISYLSADNSRHEKIRIIAPVRPYDDGITNSRIFEILQHLGKRGTIASGFSCVKKGSIVLTWSTKRTLLLSSMGFKPVPLTKCLASSALFSTKNDFKDILRYQPEQLFPELFHTLESIKLENSVGFIYKLLER